MRGEIQPGRLLDVLLTRCHSSDSPADVRVTWTPSQEVSFDGETGAAIVLETRSSPETADLLDRRLAIQSLEFVDADNKPTIVGGSVRIEGIDAPPVGLISGDTLLFTTQSELTIRRLVMDANVILIDVTGEVSGYSLNGQSRLPSWLHWLSANELTTLYVAALSSGMAFIWLAIQPLDLLRL